MATITIDAKQWGPLMQSYVAFSKKSYEQALPKQMAKIFYEGRKGIIGPHGNMIASMDAIDSVINSKRFQVWYMDTTFGGRANWTAEDLAAVSPGPDEDENSFYTPNTTNPILDRVSLAKRRSAVKFMWAVMSKMGARMANRSIPFEAKFPHAKSYRKDTPMGANASQIEIGVRMQTNDIDGGSKKESIFRIALKVGEKLAVQDVEAYISRKLNSWDGMGVPKAG